MMVIVLPSHILHTWLPLQVPIYTRQQQVRYRGSMALMTKVCTIYLGLDTDRGTGRSTVCMNSRVSQGMESCSWPNSCAGGLYLLCFWGKPLWIGFDDYCSGWYPHFPIVLWTASVLVDRSAFRRRCVHG